jgi:hypothetical protein
VRTWATNAPTRIPIPAYIPCDGHNSVIRNSTALNRYLSLWSDGKRPCRGTLVLNAPALWLSKPYYFNTSKDYYDPSGTW